MNMNELNEEELDMIAGGSLLDDIINHRETNYVPSGFEIIA